jgi:hypothetical protein
MRTAIAPSPIGRQALGEENDGQGGGVQETA